MSIRSGTFNNPDPWPLEGSEIGDYLTEQYVILTPYWSTDTSANQYFVWPAEMNGATGYTHNVSAFYTCAAVYNVSSISVSGDIWRTHILDSVAAGIDRVTFSAVSGGTTNLGYTGHAGGSPTASPANPVNGSRPQLTSPWNVMVSNLDTGLLDTTSMTGIDGWVNRLWNP